MSKPSSLSRKGILDTRPTCYLIGQFGVRGPLSAVHCSQSPDSRFPGWGWVENLAQYSSFGKSFSWVFQLGGLNQA
jgi:hypothetical protein